MAAEEGVKSVATNRRAGFDYELGTRYEAGIALSGGEIKSVRAGRMDLRDAFVIIRQGSAFLVNAYIPSYTLATGFNAHPDERRERRLLLQKKQINEIDIATAQKGMTVIATRAYLKKGRAKIEIAAAKGKKNYDKRHAIAEKNAKREMAQAISKRD